MRWTIGVLLPLLVLAQGSAPKKTAGLFEQNKVWTVHLKFDAAQWAAMEPKGGGGMMGPRPMGGGGPMGGPIPRFEFEGMLAPAFLKGDMNGDGRLSQDEFEALGRGWFESWDVNKKGRLGEADLRTGAGKLIEMPAMALGPGPGGPPGGRNAGPPSFGVNFEYVHADLEFEDVKFANVAVRYKGNSTYMSSRNQLKRSMKVDLNKYVKGQEMAGITTLNLHSNVMDQSFLKEPLSHRLFRDGKVPAPRSAYARVYLTVAGKYDRKFVGLYSIVEDIDEEFIEERYGKAAGAIFKPSTRNLFGYLGEDWKRYKDIYDPKTKLSEAQRKRVIDTARFVSEAKDEEFNAKAAEYFDLEEAARYMAINVWLSNMDSILGMGHNYYLHLDAKTQKFQILPWDLDLSFGGMGGGTDLSIEQPWRGEMRFLERLYKAPVFKDAYLKRMKEYNETIFAADRIAKLVGETNAALAAAKEQERTERAQDGEAQRSQRGPGGPGGPGVEAFAAARVKSVAAQLAGESKGQVGGGGFGGPGGMRGPGGGGPGMIFAPSLLKALDADGDKEITKQEFAAGFARWFEAWGGKDGGLTAEQLRAGIRKDLAPQMPGPGMGPVVFQMPARPPQE